MCSLSFPYKSTVVRFPHNQAIFSGLLDMGPFDIVMKKLNDSQSSSDEVSMEEPVLRAWLCLQAPNPSLDARLRTGFFMAAQGKLGSYFML